MAERKRNCEFHLGEMDMLWTHTAVMIAHHGMHLMLPSCTLQNSTVPFILSTCCCDERDGIKTGNIGRGETVGSIKITITLRLKLSSFSNLLMLCVESHQEATLILTFCENKMVLLPRKRVSELAGEYQSHSDSTVTSHAVGHQENGFIIHITLK